MIIVMIMLITLITVIAIEIMIMGSGSSGNSSVKKVFFHRLLGRTLNALVLLETP